MRLLEGAYLWFEDNSRSLPPHTQLYICPDIDNWGIGYNTQEKCYFEVCLEAEEICCCQELNRARLLHAELWIIKLNGPISRNFCWLKDLQRYYCGKQNPAGVIRITPTSNGPVRWCAFDNKLEFIELMQILDDPQSVRGRFGNKLAAYTGFNSFWEIRVFNIHSDESLAIYPEAYNRLYRK